MPKAVLDRRYNRLCRGPLWPCGHHGLWQSSNIEWQIWWKENLMAHSNLVVDLWVEIDHTIILHVTLNFHLPKEAVGIFISLEHTPHRP